MSDEPTTIDWVLHKTRGHTPTENWNGQGTPIGFNITWHDTADQRWDEEEAHMAECNQWLVRNAPSLREEVIRLRAWKKLVCDIVQQQDGSHLREMLKELVE
jgi:hypothetical protein